MATSLQTLPDDLISDILLRLPPDDPAGLVWASAVCTAWRRIVADPAFAGRYRALHPTAPVLGFLHSPSSRDLSRFLFVSTTSFRPPAADLRQCHVLDCRHGRAVFFDYGTLDSYVVLDLATGERHELPQVPHVWGNRPAVVCAAGEGCGDHRGCSGGPFVVAFVCLTPTDDGDDDDDDDTDGDDGDGDGGGSFLDAHACFYASDTGDWSVHTTIHLDHWMYHLNNRPAALVGDSLYFLCWQGILRYRYGLLRRLGTTDTGIREDDILSMMELPTVEHLSTGTNIDVAVMAAEGGGLGLACLCPRTRTMLYLLARETDDAAGSSRWVQRRVIDLKKLLPLGYPKRKPCLSGVSQDANVVFVSTEDGVFSIDHGRPSLQARKVCEKGVVVDWMFPFVSFYTESLLLKLASSKLPAAVGNQ